jgi:hypothetical protein
MNNQINYLSTISGNIFSDEVSAHTAQQKSAATPLSRLVTAVAGQ